MRYGVRLVLLGALLPALGGCIARTALDVVTAPVKAVSKGVDLATTSQSEADEKRGREMRQREERLGQLERMHNRAAQRCAQGDGPACDRSAALADQIAALSPTAPVAAR